MKFVKRAAAVLALAVIAASTSAQSAALEYKPVGYNELRKVNLDGTATSDFRVKMINFVDESGEWEKINLNPTKDANGWHIKDAPYTADMPLRANGEIKFTSTNRYSIREKSIRDDAPVSAIKKFTGAANVLGRETKDGILYENALPDIGADLLLQPHEMSFRYLVVWQSLPTVCTTPETSFRVPFTQKFGDGISPRKKDNARVRNVDESIKDGYAARVNEFRGIGMPKGRIWDSSSKSKVIDIVGNLKVDTLYGAKVIDCAFFEGAQYPVTTDATSTFYPDPSVEVTSVDGALYNEVANWPTNHDSLTCTNPDDSSTAFYIQATRLYSLQRSATLFDTSALTAGATVTSAVYSVYVTGVGDALSDSMRVVTVNPASNTALVAADFNQALWGTTALATDKTLASLTTSAYNNYTLTDLTVVSKTSITKLGLRSVVIDIGNSEPTAGANSVTMSAAETSGTSQDPKLVVTYTAPGGNGPIIILLSGILNIFSPLVYAR